MKNMRTLQKRIAYQLQQGSLDAVMPYSCSEQRRRISVCSDPVVQGEIVLFQRTDQQLRPGRLQQLLEGAAVAVEDAGTAPLLQGCTSEG